MIASCSYGIEPLFALAYFKKVMGSYELPELNKDLVVALKRYNRIYSQELIERVASQGSIQTLEAIPEKIRRVFVTAMDIPAEDHVRMQAAFQKYTDNAVSKTINMPGNASVEDVLDAYILAWKLKCKGITVYRDKSRTEQVLNVGNVQKKANRDYRIENREKNSEMCPECGERLQLAEGCASCQNCGYSRCSL